MAYIVEPGPDRQLGPTVTAGGGGYDSPHSRRERALWKKYGTSPTGQQHVYEKQRHFAVQLMHKYGIQVPPGVDPVVYFHEVGSKLIWQKTHGGRGQQETMGQQHPGAPSHVKPPAFVPPAAGGNIGQPAGPLQPRANPMAGLGQNLATAIGAQNPMAGLGQNLATAIGAQASALGAHGAGAPAGPSAKPVPKPKPASHAPASAHAAGLPTAKQAKHKLALDLLVSALTAKPPAFHGLANTFQHGL